MAAIRIDIASEFKDKGFKNAQKSTDKLNRSFTNLQRTAVKTFVAVAGIRALRNSIRAFADEDKAVKNLTQSLNNLGLGYNVGAIENFISATQAATGVSDDQLRPAMVELVQVTLDAQKATELLNSAMDLSTGTGSGLNASIKALTRAYNGNYTSLGKLQRVYTSAELEAMGFEKALAALNETFGGTAAANADSYGGKIDRLNVAVDEARETIGKGLVDAFETLADGDFDKVIDAIAASARGLSGFMRNIAFSIQYTKALLKTGWTIGQDEQAQLDMIRQQWTNPADTSNTAAANRVFLRNMQSQLALQKKIAAERAKSAKLAEKEKKNQELLSKEKSALDLEKIQIEAALKGKISEEERTRLLLMQAIATENATAAEQLLKKLQDIQAENAKLAKQLTEFPKANDPFEDWTTTLTSVQAQLLAIAQKKIVVDFLANFSPISSAAITAITKPSAASSAAAVATNPAAAAAAAATDAAVAAAAGDAAAAQAAADSAAADAIIAAAEAAAALAAAKTAEEKAAAESMAKAAEAAAEAAKVLEESAAVLAVDAATAAATAAAAEAADAERVAALLEAEAAAKAAADALAAASIDFDASIIGAIASGAQPITTITVNVEGSVISQDDLVSAITDAQQQNQKNGTGLLYDAVAI